MIGAPRKHKEWAGKVIVAITIPLMYFGLSSEQGTYNPLKWKSSAEYYEMENKKSGIEQSLADSLNKNPCAVIDSTEFIYRK